MNLLQGLFLQMERCRDLVKIYNEIPTGIFGATMIETEIQTAEKAIADGDVVEMVKSYQRLRDCK